MVKGRGVRRNCMHACVAIGSAVLMQLASPGIVRITFTIVLNLLMLKVTAARARSSM